MLQRARRGVQGGSVRFCSVCSSAQHAVMFSMNLRDALAQHALLRIPPLPLIPTRRALRIVEGPRSLNRHGDARGAADAASESTRREGESAMTLGR
jgi:hypothetical protein